MIHELNQATADLKMNRPDLETELMKRFYYSRFDKKALLTTEETEYIDKKRAVVIGYLDGCYPFSYEEDGEFRGLARDVLENGVSAVGLRFEYYRIENRQEAHEALKNGDIDVLAYCTDAGNAEVQKRDGLKPASRLADVPLVLVVRKNEDNAEIGKLATVSPEGNEPFAPVLGGGGANSPGLPAEPPLAEGERRSADCQTIVMFLLTYVKNEGILFSDSGCSQEVRQCQDPKSADASVNIPRPSPLHRRKRRRTHSR